MEKHPLTQEDQELVDVALKLVNEKFDWKRHWVAAALRTKSGAIHTAVNLYADSAMLSLCAEPIAIGNAVEDTPGDDIDTIVTVYRKRKSDPPEVKVVSPCGRCREIIVDYGPNTWVILRDPGSQDLFKIKSTDLLPYRYEDYRQEEQAA